MSKFKRGERVVIIKRNYYGITGFGSEGKILNCTGGEARVKFYKVAEAGYSPGTYTVAESHLKSLEVKEWDD